MEAQGVASKSEPGPRLSAAHLPPQGHIRAEGGLQGQSWGRAGGGSPYATPVQTRAHTQPHLLTTAVTPTLGAGKPKPGAPTFLDARIMTGDSAYDRATSFILCPHPHVANNNNTVTIAVNSYYNHRIPTPGSAMHRVIWLNFHINPFRELLLSSSPLISEETGLEG